MKKKLLLPSAAILLALFLSPLSFRVALASPGSGPSASDQLAAFWAQVKAEQGQQPAPAAKTKLGRIWRTIRNVSRMRAAFSAMEQGRDVIEADRDKPIHSKPARLVRMRFRASASGLSGALSDNTEYLARFSLGAPTAERHTPGVALKAFRGGGQPSLNYLAITSLDGQGTNANPFFQSPSNGITEPRSFLGKVAARTLALFSGNDEAWIPVDHFGKVGGKAPFEIRLVPTPEARSLGAKAGSYTDRLDRVTAGTPLYEVHVRFSNDESTLTKIGTLETSSEMVSSAFGAKVVFGHKSVRRTRGQRWKNRAVQLGRLLTFRSPPQLKHGPQVPRQPAASHR